MRVILQRVLSGSVLINGKEKREIGKGLVVLVGFMPEDTNKEVEFLADKLLNIRIFSDKNGAMNLSLKDIEGELLVVSNFTLYANSKKGRRPSFTGAAPPDTAIPLYESFVDRLSEDSQVVKTGEFGADMKVDIANDGPVTIILDNAY